MLFSWESTWIHVQSTTEFCHEGTRFGFFEFFAVDALVEPTLLGPFHEAEQFSGHISGFVLAIQAEILDFSFVRLAELVDLLTGNGVYSSNG